MSAIDEKLLPCPFCGSRFKMGQEPHDNHPVAGQFYIYHVYGDLGSDARKCLLNVYQHFDTEEQAVIAWNRRSLAPQQAAPMQGVKARLFIRNYLIERDEACGFVSDEDEWDESAREIYEGLSVLATPEAGTSEPVADALRSGLSLLLLADAIGAGRFDAIIPEVAAAQLRTADALLQRLSAPAQAPVDGEAVRDRDVILRGVVESRMEGRLAKVLGISQYPSTSALDFDELLEIVSDRLAAAPSARKEKAE